MAQVLAAKGVDGFVFRGDDGLDEITLATSTTLLTIGNGDIASHHIDPKDFGIDTAPVSELVGGDAQENARITRAIFAGKRGAPRDAVVLNAAAAIAAFEGKQNESVEQRITDGLIAAKAAVDTGAASELLERWITLTAEIAAD